jgi:hypothetical protein
MATLLAAPVHRRTDPSRGSDLAAVVIVLDGRRAEWRADGLASDADVTDWLAGALTGRHPDYASLWWADLAQLRLHRRN